MSIVLSIVLTIVGYVIGIALIPRIIMQRRESGATLELPLDMDDFRAAVRGIIGPGEP